MAGTEIANAYVALTVRATGAKASIEKAIGGSDVQGVMDKQGQSMGGKLMSSMGTAMKRTAIGAGIAAGAAVGAALVTGFRSALQQQDIQATVAGLYGDGEKAAATLQKIKDVAGTSPIDYSAYGKAAQSLAYAGVEGDRAVNVLENVGAALVGAGGGSEELERAMAGVLKGVNNGGIVMNDTLNIISESGFPIISALQEKFGTTGDVIKDMAAKGKISIDDVLSVMENGTGALTKAQMAAADEVSKTFGNQWTIAKDNIAVAIGGVMIPLLEKVAPIIKPVSDAIVGFVNKIPDIAKFADTASYFSPLGIVLKALQPILPTLGKALSDLGKIFMDLVNQVMPILLPIFQTLIGLLSEVFKAVVPIVQMVISALAPAFKALAPIVVTIFKAFQPLIDILVAILVPIIQVLANIIQAVLTPVLGILTGAIEIVSNVITWLAENTFPMLVAAGQWLASIFTPIFEGIGAVFTWIYENIIAPIVTLIVNYFRIWGAIVAWLWTNAVQPIFNAIGAIFKWIWETIISPIVGYIGAALTVLGDVFSWLYENAIRPAWEGISSAISTAWNWINTNVFTPMKTGIDAVGKAFDAVGKFIGEVWTNIQNAAKAPVRFLIDTVWNDGIRSFAVDVLKALGLNDIAKGLPRISMPFADGGVLPGYTPGRDVHQFYSPTGGGLALSGGEAIMRPEFTRAVGGAAGVARLNSMARKGQAFKDGGVWGDIGSFAGDVWDNIAGAASVAWEFITDPVGAVKKHMAGFVSGMGGDGAFSEIIAGVPKTLMRGFESFFESAAPKGVGTAGMGWEAMWQIVQNAIPGVVKTSDYRPGAMTVNGGKSYHGSGRAIDLVPASMDTFNAVARLFPNASELIYSPAGNRQLQNGKPFNGWSDAVRAQHYNHVHLAMANGGVVPKLYDQGGWLPSGGMAVNKSGKPEAVLTPKQSEALIGGLGSGSELRLVVDGHEFNAYVEGKADGRIGMYDDSERRTTKGRLRQW